MKDEKPGKKRNQGEASPPLKDTKAASSDIFLKASPLPSMDDIVASPNTQKDANNT